MVTRRFGASAEQVFDAWLDPERVRQWLFTTPGSAVRIAIDPRVGGTFTVADRRGEAIVVHHGTFLEIERPHRLRFRFWVADQPEAVDVVTAEVAPDGSGFVLTVTHELHPDWADYVDFTHKTWESMFDRLAGSVGPDAGRSLTITRILHAPRALVFRMWAEPEHMNRWCVPKDFSIVSGTMDFRPGGAWSSHMRGSDGTDYRMRGVYRDIVPDTRIAFTHAWVDEVGRPGLETVITVTFEDHGSGTKLTFHQAAFETVGARDSHAEGWGETLDSLAAHLGAVAGLTAF